MALSFIFRENYIPYYEEKVRIKPERSYTDMYESV